MPRLAALALLLLGAGACVIQCGPDCTDACDKVLTCDGLDKTFRLACAAGNALCPSPSPEFDCAVCIDEKSCAQIIDGACDFATDGGTLCLVEKP